MNSKTKNMVGIGLFTAIVVVLQLLGGGIKIGTMFSISFVLLPIVVGSAVYGWFAGAWLGFAFGVTVLLTGDAATFMAVDPLATVSVVLIKGALSGLCAGLVFKLFERAGNFLATMAAGIICPVVNTGIFLLGCKFFFFEKITEWASLYGFENAGKYMIFGLAGVNFLIELGVNIVLAPVITRLIKLGKK